MPRLSVCEDKSPPAPPLEEDDDYADTILRDDGVRMMNMDCEHNTQAGDEDGVCVCYLNGWCTLFICVDVDHQSPEPMTAHEDEPVVTGVDG